MKTIIIGGSWGEKSGRPSIFTDTFAKGAVVSKKFKEIVLLNGGAIDEIVSMVEKVGGGAKSLIWIPESTTDLSIIRPHCDEDIILLTKEINDSGKLSPQSILTNGILSESDLVMEVTTQHGVTRARLVDVLGNQWRGSTNDFSNIGCSASNRINDLIDMSKKSLVKPAKMSDKSDVPEEKDDFKKFIKVVREKFDFISKEGMFTKQFSRLFSGSASIRMYDLSLGINNAKELNYSSILHTDMSEICAKDFVRSGIKEWKSWFIGTNLPNENATVQLKLLSILPRVNFVVHAHAYVYNAHFNNNIVPCGSYHEIKEIVEVIKKHSLNKLSCFSVNLIGHGSTTVCNNPDELESVTFVSRTLYENVKSRNDQECTIEL